MNEIILNTQTSYNQVATEYAEKFKDEMDDKPFDRDCLDRLAREVGDLGPICDLGCGPGQIARYLHRQGVDTLGVDLSPNMIAEAQRLNPEIPFHQGDMLIPARRRQFLGWDRRLLLHHPYPPRKDR